ncbi:MAG: DUF2062 domain-containing protein [Verrucomicrobiota bacterium]
MRKAGDDDSRLNILINWIHNRWRRWLVIPVLNQLTGGIAPTKIAWTISLGVVLGIFPIFGTPATVCLLVGWLFRLNQPVLHVFRMLVYPLHLALILVFIHMGERLYGVPLISFSIPQMVVKFQQNPMKFFSDFRMAAWHGVSAWLLIAPIIAILIKLLATPMLTRLAARLEKRTVVMP